VERGIENEMHRNGGITGCAKTIDRIEGEGERTNSQWGVQATAFLRKSLGLSVSPEKSSFSSIVARSGGLFPFG